MIRQEEVNKAIALNFYNLCCGTYSGDMSYKPMTPSLHSFLAIFQAPNEHGFYKVSSGQALDQKDFIEFLEAVVTQMKGG